MSGIRLQWEGIERALWDRIYNKIPRSNIFQHWDIGQCIAEAEGMHLRRALIMRGAKAIGLLQLYEKHHLFGLRSARLIRGPLFASPPGTREMLDSLTMARKQFPLFRGCWTTLQPELPDTQATLKFLSEAGLNRIMTGYETAWVDLRQPPEDRRTNLHPKWRNQLAKAESNGILIESDRRLEPLLERHADHRGKIGYGALSTDSYHRIPEENRLILTAGGKGELLASALFLIHGRSATYQISWNSGQGREAQATNLLLWRAMEKLSRQGIHWLDLGGIDEVKNPGLARFKNRIGGEKSTLAGTFI